MRLSFLIFVALLQAAFTQKNDTVKLQRNFVPTFDAQPTVRAYYNTRSSVRPNYPLLAQITPVNENNDQISDAFTAYIYPSSVSPLLYPYYSVLCQKEPNKYSNSSTGDFKSHLQPLHEKIKELSEKMKALSDFFNKNATILNEKLEKSTPIKNVKEDDKVNDGKQIEHSEQVSSNVQTNVLQCDGVTCPETATTCKITDHAIEPHYEEILRTVFCLSSTGDVLNKIEKKIPNPNKGSSLDSSRTVDRQDFHQAMQDEFNSALENFDFKVFDKFKTFNDWDFDDDDDRK